MNRSVMRLVQYGVLAVTAAACSSQAPIAPVPVASSEAPASAPLPPGALQLHLLCLTPADVLQQIKACTAAINSGLLPDKELANALAVRGSAYLRLMRLSDARIDLEQAKRLDPVNPLIDRGLVLLETADRQMRPDQRRQVEAAGDCSGFADASEQLRGCDQLVAEAEGDPAFKAQALSLRALAKLYARDIAGAIADLDQAVALDPQNDKFRDYRSRALFMGERYAEAMPGLQAALEANPFETMVKSMVGTTYYVRGDLQRAYAEYQTLRSWEAVDGVASARAAIIQSELGDGENLFEQFAKWPGVPPWLRLLGKYRSTFVPETEFRSDMATLLFASDEDVGCLIEFQIAHKAAMERRPGAARVGFAKAAKLCKPADFEFHAAKSWLVKLQSAGWLPEGRTSDAA